MYRVQELNPEIIKKMLDLQLYCKSVKWFMNCTPGDFKCWSLGSVESRSRSSSDPSARKLVCRAIIEVLHLHLHLVVSNTVVVGASVDIFATSTTYNKLIGKYKSRF